MIQMLMFQRNLTFGRIISCKFKAQFCVQIRKRNFLECCSHSYFSFFDSSWLWTRVTRSASFLLEHPHEL